MTEFTEWAESWAKREVKEWACNSQRGLEYPGSWSTLWGPEPADWRKEKCNQADCPRCAPQA